MAKGEDGTGGGTPDTSVFEQPANLREPAAPRVPRVAPPAPVPVVPLPGEERVLASREEPPETPEEAREATDALLHEMLEGEDVPESSDAPARTLGSRPSREEDWPPELHALPVPEE